MTTKHRFYVYVDFLKKRSYSDNHPPIPVYVGKGVSNRVKSIKRNSDHTLLRELYGIDRVVVAEFDNEDEAYDFEEVCMIKLQTLKGMTPWGCNLVMGFGCPKAAQPKSEEHKAKIGAANKGKTGLSGSLNPMYGKQLSDEHKAKLSAALSGKQLSDEHKAKLSAANCGENNPRFGKQHTAETKAKMAAARKEYFTKKKAEETQTS